jgi:hypothetical protein
MHMSLGIPLACTCFYLRFSAEICGERLRANLESSTAKDAKEPAGRNHGRISALLPEKPHVLRPR